MLFEYLLQSGVYGISTNLKLMCTHGESVGGGQGEGRTEGWGGLETQTTLSGRYN